MHSDYAALTREWPSKARSDLEYARASFREFDDFYAQMCILCHDSAEKYLKALLVSEGVRPERTHDLLALLHQCCPLPGMEGLERALEEACRLLNAYYVPLKYPSHFPPLTRDHADRALAAADSVERAARELLGTGGQGSDDVG
jgi:HEPN domain-containing protein